MRISRAEAAGGQIANGTSLCQLGHSDGGRLIPIAFVVVLRLSGTEGRRGQFAGTDSLS